MTERFCRINKLGSCYGCPNLDLVKKERVARPNVGYEAAVQAVGVVMCPRGERPVLPVLDVRKISSDRFVGR